MTRTSKASSRNGRTMEHDEGTSNSSPPKQTSNRPALVFSQSASAGSSKTGPPTQRTVPFPLHESFGPMWTVQTSMCSLVNGYCEHMALLAADGLLSAYEPECLEFAHRCAVMADMAADMTGRLKALSDLLTEMFQSPPPSSTGTTPSARRKDV